MKQRKGISDIVFCTMATGVPAVSNNEESIDAGILIAIVENDLIFKNADIALPNIVKPTNVIDSRL